MLLVAGWSTSSAAASPPRAGAESAARIVALGSADQTPVRLARSLAQLQLRIARGDRAAISRQAAGVVEAGNQLNSLAESVWSDARNRQALVKLVLSGGDPSLLSRLVASGRFPAEEAALAEGTVEFATGNREAAIELLSEVDHRMLAVSLSGHVALAKAALKANLEAAKAIELCLEARLLSPGTHVEEAALRLATELSIRLGDEARFESAAIGYLFRFPSSAYADSFLRRVARVMGAIGYLERHRGLRLVGTATRLLPAERRVAFLVELAEAALGSGKFKTAALASQMAGEGLPAESEVAARAGAVLGAARIGLGEIAEGRPALPEAEGLTARTGLQDLVRSAHRVAELVTAGPERPTPTPAEVGRPATTRASGPGSESRPPPPFTGEVASIVANATARLAEVEKLINEGGG